MRSNKKGYRLMSRSQMVGAILFGLLMAGVIGTGIWLHKVKSSEPYSTDEVVLMQDRALAIENRLKTSDYTYADKRKENTSQTFTPQLHPFDPNSADSITLIQEGLPHWIVRMMLNYRRKGGKYRKTEDLKKIPYLSDSLYAQVAPYVRIDSSLYQNDTDTLPGILPHHWRVKKDTVLELNSCDTAALLLLRGIGTYTAQQIVTYRKRLGGYVSVGQLREIKGLEAASDTLLQHFVVCTDSVRPIQVNHSSVERLQRHPYIRFRQAQALYDYRRERYRLHSIEDLRDIEEFTSDDLQRLLPYLSFED